LSAVEDETDRTGPVARSGRPSSPCWLAAGLAALVVVAVIQMWPSVALDYYHDESWRIDVVRSADPIGYMRELHSTPTAVGWVYVNKGLLAPLPYSYTLVRLVTVGWFAVFLGATGLLVYRVGRVRGQPRLPWSVPVLTCAALTLMQVFSRLYSYFNNYTFEAAWVAVALLLAFELERRRWAFVALVAMLATAPLFVIGALLALPGLYLRLGADLRERAAAWRDWLIVATAGALSGVVVLVEYLGLYRDGDRTEPVPLDVFWKDDILGLGDNGFIELALRTLEQLEYDLVGWSWLSDAPGFTVMARLVLVAAALVGAVDLWRRWKWYVVVPLLGWLVVVPASVFADIPMTAVRSNFAWMSPLYVIVAFGLVRALWVLAGRWPVVATAGSAVLVLGLFWHAPQPADPTLFARGLRDDLQVIADSPSTHNVVLSYHHMSQSYTHDVLVNDAPAGDYEIIREWSGDRFLYDEVDEIIASRLRPGDALWCVIPYALGPEESDRACRFDDPRLREIVAGRRNASEIRGYLLE
jgi:hypothetical protein